MPDMIPMTVSSQALYETIIHPHFADLIPAGEYRGTLSEFTVMNDVTSSRRIIDILGGRNILKRRDASCKIEFSTIGKLKTRRIEVDKIYGAVQDCEDEFYVGCLEDFQNQSETFRNYIMDFFEKAIRVDLDSNAYFGDIARADDPSGLWSWNVFDGIFKKYAAYINDGTIAAAQTTAIPDGAVSPTNANAYLDFLFDNQTTIMKSLPPVMKAFYVSDSIFRGYQKFLQNIGGGFNIEYYTNGIPKLAKEGIPVLLEPTWLPIMTALNGGTEANAAILTIRGNFVFATDKSYGVYDSKTNKYVALKVWYSDDDNVWKYVVYMKAGTEVALPEHTVMAITNI